MSYLSGMAGPRYDQRLRQLQHLWISGRNRVTQERGNARELKSTVTVPRVSEQGLPDAIRGSTS